MTQRNKPTSQIQPKVLDEGQKSKLKHEKWEEYFSSTRRRKKVKRTNELSGEYAMKCWGKKNTRWERNRECIFGMRLSLAYSFTIFYFWSVGRSAIWLVGWLLAMVFCEPDWFTSLVSTRWLPLLVMIHPDGYGGKCLCVCYVFGLCLLRQMT